MKKCLEKRRLLDRKACLSCPKRFKSCEMTQELIDSNVFLRVYLDEDGRGDWIKLLNKNNKMFVGYISTIQISHILRRFYEKISKAEKEAKKDSLQVIGKLKSNLDKFIQKLGDFHIIDFNQEDLKLLNDLQEETSLRTEFHDRINIAIAINNKLNIQAIDNDLLEDFPTIKEISKGFGHNIRINEEF